MPLIETFRRYTPLGLRFWDAATDTRVSGALAVRVWLEDDPRQQVSGRPTVGGNVAVHNIPGLSEVERSGVPAGTPPGSLPQATYVVEVKDLDRRFVPTAFRVDLPRAERGFYTIHEDGSPPEDRPPGVFLFSAPERPVPTQLASVRASMRRADTGAPVAFAAVYAELDDGGADPAGRLWAGVSDANGNVQILFPYPRVEFVPPPSPPSDSRPLSEYTWPLRFRVHSAPDDLDTPDGAEVPDLQSIFDQDPATLIPDASAPSTSSPDLAVSLQHGRPCVAATANAPPEERGYLRVQPA